MKFKESVCWGWQTIVNNAYVQWIVTSLAQVRVAVRPHDAAAAALDGGVVQGVHDTLGVSGGVEVHVRVAQGAAGDACDSSYSWSWSWN